MTDTTLYGLATRAELEKLQPLLNLSDDAWRALGSSGAQQIRALREDIEAEIHDYRRENFLRLARRLRLLSVKRLTRLAVRIGPLLCGRLVSEMDPYIAVRVARQLAPDFLGQAAAAGDPQKIRELIRGLPADLIRDVALLMINKQQFILLGRFADALSAPAIRQVVQAVDDDAVLLKIAFYMEETSQLSNIIRMIDNDRVARIIRSGTEDPSLWPLAIWVVERVEGELKSRLANIMVEEQESTLNELVTVADQQNLWGPVLRALAAVNPRHHRKIVNLPALRDDRILTNLVKAGYDEDLFVETLPLVKAMHRDYQKIIAHAALRQGEEVAEAVLEAAHAADQWDLILELAQHLDSDERDALARLPITHNAMVMETLMKSAARNGKMPLLLDFARRFHKEGLQTVVEISVRDGGELLEGFLDAARQTENGWQAIGVALSVVDDEQILGEVNGIYRRQSDNDKQAIQQAAQAIGMNDSLSKVLQE